MRNPYSVIVLVVLVVGIALPIAIGAVKAARSVRADIEARYDSVDYPH